MKKDLNILFASLDNVTEIRYVSESGGGKSKLYRDTGSKIKMQLKNTFRIKVKT